MCPRSMLTGAVAIFCCLPALAQEPATLPSLPAATQATSPPTTAPVFSANSRLSMDQLRQLLDEKKYQELIQRTSKLLASGPTGSSEYNRFELMKLKAEAQVQRGDWQPAIATLEDLAKQTNDNHDRDVATATIELIRKSPGGKFVPKIIPPGNDRAQTVEIKDPEKRKQAFAAFYADQLLLVNPKIKVAMASVAVPAIFPAIDAVKSTRPLDVAANDSDAKTTEQLEKLAAHGRKLMSTLVKQLAGRQADIEHEANHEVQTITYMVDARTGISVPFTNTHRQGLTDRNLAELRDMIDTCSKVAPAADALAKASGSDLETADLIAEANRVSAKAKDLLDTNFADTGMAPGYVR